MYTSIEEVLRSNIELDKNSSPPPHQLSDEGKLYYEIGGVSPFRS